MLSLKDVVMNTMQLQALNIARAVNAGALVIDSLDETILGCVMAGSIESVEDLWEECPNWVEPWGILLAATDQL